MNRYTTISKEFMERLAFRSGEQIEFSHDRAFLTLGRETFVAMLDTRAGSGESVERAGRPVMRTLALLTTLALMAWCVSFAARVMANPVPGAEWAAALALAGVVACGVVAVNLAGGAS